MWGNLVFRCGSDHRFLWPAAFPWRTHSCVARRAICCGAGWEPADRLSIGPAGRQPGRSLPSRKSGSTQFLRLQKLGDSPRRLRSTGRVPLVAATVFVARAAGLQRRLSSRRSALTPGNPALRQDILVAHALLRAASRLISTPALNQESPANRLSLPFFGCGPTALRASFPTCRAIWGGQ